MEAEVEEAFSVLNNTKNKSITASHANINRDGTRMSLLAAINISSKNKSQTQKYVESAKRKDTANINTQASEDLSQQEQYISLLEKRIQLEEKLYEAVLKRKQVERE
ncbi:20760_t:CDS:2 [Entrophospora sp. SA101]|nr:20760_t:CDS:2 [Entrophospora sp. SA101]